MNYSVIFVLASIILLYIRRDNTPGSHTAGQRIIQVNSFHKGDVVEFVLRSNETSHTHSTIKQTIMHDGPCGNSPTNVHPLKRS